MTLSELEATIQREQILAVNIQWSGGFRVHVRRDVTRGFECAQQRHDTLADALREHFPADRPDGIEDELLV